MVLHLNHGPVGSCTGPHQPALVSLTNRIIASRLLLLGAAQRGRGECLSRVPLQARSASVLSSLASTAPKALGALALAGTTATRTLRRSNVSGAEPRLSDFGHPARRVCDLLLALHVVIFGLQVLSRGSMLQWGAKVNSRVAQGELYRLVSCTFLHGSAWHLLANCQALSALGPFVELNAGHARFLALYAVSAVSGSVASYMFNPSASVGASGAIFGVGAAMAMILYRHRDAQRAFSKIMLKSLGQSLLISAVIGAFMPQIDNWGHAGGLAGGGLACFLLGPRYVNQGGIVKDQPPIALLANRGLK